MRDWTGGRESAAEREGRRGGERGEDGGVTHRVQGPGEEESDASREGLVESTYTQLEGDSEQRLSTSSYI